MPRLQRTWQLYMLLIPRTHYNRFCTIIDDDEGIETFEEYKNFVMVMVGVYDLITYNYVKTMIYIIIRWYHVK